MVPLSRIGVIGAGIVGSGIARKAAREGFDVVLIDTKPEYLDRASATLRQHLKQDLAQSGSQHLGILTDAESVLSRIEFSTDPRSLENVQIVFEVVPEDRNAKISTFKNINSICKADTIFSTSATSWPADEIFKSVSDPSRCLGIHFFDHPAERPIAEVVIAKKTSEPVVERALSILRTLGISTVVSQEAPGFIVKRLSAALLSEAVRISVKGEANLVTIDAAACDALGLDLGPFALMNQRGIEVARHMSRGLAQHLGDFYAQPDRLRAQEMSGENWSLDGDIDPQKKPEITEIFLGLAVLVGTAIASEGVAKPEDIDLAAKLGLGWRMGPFALANSIGPLRATKLALAVAQLREVDVPSMLGNRSAADAPWPLQYATVKMKGEVATISINRPDVLNALNATVIGQIARILDKVEADDSIKTIVFTSAAKVFAGGLEPDIMVSKIGQNETADILAVYRLAGDLFTRISLLPQTTIARAEGLTLSSGIELGLACDYLLAGPRAVFQFPETGLGIHPGFGATQRLPRKVGKAIGKYVLLTGEAMDADSAFRLGIVDAVADSEEAIDTILADLATGEALSTEDAIPTDQELAAISLFNSRNADATLKGKLPAANPTSKRIGELLKRKAPVALTLVNKLIDDGLGLELEKALHFELASLELILQTKDALVGLASSAGKGSPVFRGE